MSKILLLTVATLLSGCATTPLVITGLGIGSVAVSETTGRTATDHVVSAANGGQDCRVGRVLKKEEVCQPNGTVRLQVTTTNTKPSTTEEIQNKYR